MSNPKIIESIQILLYKENPSLLEKLNFEDDKIFSEPLLFAYFNSYKHHTLSKELLEEIMQGYLAIRQPLRIEHSLNKHGIAYIPELGYYNQLGENIQECCFIKDTQIEVLYSSFGLLDAIFELALPEKAIVEIEMNSSLFERFMPKIEEAFKIIKRRNPSHFKLIELHCRRVVLFKTNPDNTNSFATINAHGMAFLNIYQEDYNEIFFIDDIAHQTGHIIMTAILFERKKYFLIDENNNIGKITKNEYEYRSFYILFHALYTCYTTLLCLNNCLEDNSLDEKKIHEIKGRIGFYLIKCKLDLANFEKVINYYLSIQNVLSQDGINIFNSIVDKYIEMLNKYRKDVSGYNYNNQPYNFTYSNFIKINPLNNA
jgi:hypothetical protein